MKVHLVFKSIKHVEAGGDEVVAIAEATISGDAGLIQEVIKLLKAEGFEVS